jgi:hypothetical protein
VLDFHEATRDLEVNNTVQTSYIIEEKLPIASESTSRFRKGSALSSDDRMPSAEFAEPKPLVRKYSRKWWKSYWNNAIRMGQVPRMVYGVIGLVIVIAWIVFT